MKRDKLRLVILLSILGLLFIVGDTVSTYYALDRGAFEGNPILGYFVRYPLAVITFKFAWFIPMVLLALRVQNRPMMFAFLYVMCLMLVFVVTNNVYHYAF